MALEGGVQITGFISPTSSGDTYATHDALYGRDGLRNIDLLSDLDNISADRRRAGMIVGVGGFSGLSNHYTLLPEGTGWTYTIADWDLAFLPPSSAGLNIANTYFVTPTGDDSTAVRGDLHSPFKTITGARNKVVAELSAATITGETLIHVYPGEYTEDEIQYENGNFYFEAGAIINQPNRGGSLIGVFNLGAANTLQSNIYTANTCNIYGYVDINLGGGSLSVAHFMRGTSESIFEFNKISIGAGFGIVPWENSKIIARGYEIDGQTGQYCLRTQDDAESYLDIERIIGPSAGTALHWREFNGVSYVNVGEVIVDNSQIGLFTQGIGDGADIVGNYGIVKHVDSGSTYVVNNYLQTGGKITHNVNVLTKGNGGGIYNNQNTGGEINIIGDVRTDSQAFQLTSSNTIDNKLFYRGNIISGGILTPTRGLDIDAGTVRLDGSLDGSNGLVNGIEVNSSADLTIGSFIIEGVNTESVIGTGSINILNDLYIDKPLSTGITVTGHYIFTGTTHTQRLNIGIVGSGTAVTLLARDANGMVVSGETGGSTNKYAESIAFTGGTKQTITHNLNTEDVQVQLKDSTGTRIIEDIADTYTSNTVDIEVSITGTYRVIIIG